MDNWHEKFFNLLYWELFMKRSSQKISQEVNVIQKLVEDHKIESILDVCCGVGDIAFELGKKYNLDAWGIEYSLDYVKNNYLKNVIHGDARIPLTAQTFSLVINWFSSFAYFSKENNYKILQNCYNYCNDVFILETGNSLNIIRNFQEKITYEKEFKTKFYQVDRLSNINLKDNTLEQDWIINDGKETITYHTKNYIYFPKDIKDSLLEAGFSKVELFSLDNGQIKELNLDSPRLIVKAIK